MFSILNRCSFFGFSNLDMDSLSPWGSLAGGFAELAWITGELAVSREIRKRPSSEDPRAGWCANRGVRRQLVIMAERARTRSVHVPSKIKRPTPSFAYSWVTLR